MASDDIPTLETFTEGDTKAIVYLAIVDRNGAVESLVGKTVQIEGRKRGTAAEFTPIAATITDAAAGECEADLAALVSPSGAAGQFRCQTRIIEGGGSYMRSDPYKVVVRGAARLGLS